MSLPDSAKPEKPEEIVPEVEKALRDEQLPAAFQNLPKDVRHAVVQKLSSVAIRISHESWEGAYPSPQALQRFEEVLPGSADRIFKMAEADLDNHHLHDREVARYMHRGQIFGFILAAIALLGAIFLISIGKTITGTILGGAVLLPLVALFVTGQLQANAAGKQKSPTKGEAEQQTKLNGRAPPQPQSGKRQTGRR